MLLSRRSVFLLWRLQYGPYMASTGIYVFKVDVLHKLLQVRYGCGKTCTHGVMAGSTRTGACMHACSELRRFTQQAVVLVWS